jgi:DNA-directed RNA polymerase delta subunit
MRDSSFLPKKETHIATIHNELIKDSRFVLVGRGIYALEEWGYGIGTVKDVILKILKESKNPLKKQEVLKKVSKQRIVKDNTIFLNLQNQKYFSKDSKGRYTVREA